jgi:hypothetical protein
MNQIGTNIDDAFKFKDRLGTYVGTKSQFMLTTIPCRLHYLGPTGVERPAVCNFRVKYEDFKHISYFRLKIYGADYFIDDVEIRRGNEKAVHLMQDLYSGRTTSVHDTFSILPSFILQSGVFLNTMDLVLTIGLHQGQDGGSSSSSSIEVFYDVYANGTPPMDCDFPIFQTFSDAYMERINFSVYHDDVYNNNRHHHQHCHYQKIEICESTKNPLRTLCMVNNRLRLFPKIAIEEMSLLEYTNCVYVVSKSNGVDGEQQPPALCTISDLRKLKFKPQNNVSLLDDVKIVCSYNEFRMFSGLTSLKFNNRFTLFDPSTAVILEAM